MTVTLDLDRLARLDADAAQLGVSRAEALRRRLDETAENAAGSAADSRQLSTSGAANAAPPTREATLAMLERAAARGSVIAMATLARELRLGGPVEAVRPRRRERVRVDELTADESVSNARLAA